MLLTQDRFNKVSMLAVTLFMVLFAGAAAQCFDHTKRIPQAEDLFMNNVTNALNPVFVYNVPSNGKIEVSIEEGMWDAGLKGGAQFGQGETTKIYGYSAMGHGPTWPGMTFEVLKAKPIQVTWVNKIQPGQFIITGADNGVDGDYSNRSVVDESLHWAYSLPGYEENTIENDGVPIVTHLHGGHSDSEFDGNPEYFYNYDLSVTGPEFVTNEYSYKNNFNPTAIWYHDHALGITRLNTYAGLAGFYILRDSFDTGSKTQSNNGNNAQSNNLPTYPYEVALAIQDRMFKNCGEFLYPAFPGDPEYANFIDGTNVSQYPDKFPSGGPTALAEFFGDHMVVNGKVWPKMAVERRNYRLRLLNGCDSRFLVIQFVRVDLDVTVPGDDDLLDFYVIGADQGFKKQNKGKIDPQNTLVMGPGERFDLIINFGALEGRVIMKNSGGDEPFKGLGGAMVYDYTDRVMAFDIKGPLPEDNFDIDVFQKKLFKQNNGHPPIQGQVKRVRKVALFEGTDEYGRLQPVLGTVGPAKDYKNEIINWPDDSDNCQSQPENCTLCPYHCANLTGPVEGTVGWHTHPSTENPKQNDVEEWEIWNVSEDAHPIHLHLVDFEVLSRHAIETCVRTDPQHLVQHNGLLGEGAKIVFEQGCDPGYGSALESSEYQPSSEPAYVDIGYPKDVVIALPQEVTKIKAKFHKKGRFVWHCHLLSHEDHEMMRVMYVGDETATQRHLRGESENVKGGEGEKES